MTRTPSIRSVVAILALVGGACSSSSSPPSGNGGSHGNGGATSQGGATGSGGAVQPGTGGATGTGGRSGSGGTGTGGQPGVGGTGVGGTSTASGGTAIAGSGGRGASGGAAGNGNDTGMGGSSALGGTTSQPGTGGATVTGGAAGRDAGPGTGGTGGGTSMDAGSSSAGTVPSAGCGKTPTLKNSPSTTTFTQNTVSISGTSRQFILRWPDNYDNSHPYRLIIGLHGATGKGSDVAGNPAYFGLFALANNSTIFIAPSADGGLWSAATDTAFVDEILKAAFADLCIDTSRVMLEGFSQGAAMSWTLACSRPNVFRAVVGHSGGGVANPTSCQPVAYFGSGGLQENVTQTTQTDQFAKWDGCTVETLPKAPTGGHVCTSYNACSAGHPVRWCNYDGPHTPSPTDSGKSTSWMPSEVWPFFSQF